jgi:hypothetical protein
MEQSKYNSLLHKITFLFEKVCCPQVLHIWQGIQEKFIFFSQLVSNYQIFFGLYQTGPVPSKEPYLEILSIKSDIC